MIFFKFAWELDQTLTAGEKKKKKLYVQNIFDVPVTI